jgi:non-homologous end joining protein Ku
MSEAVWAEAVWNVFLRLSLISCPVRLVPATAPIDREFEALLSESGGIIDLSRFVRRDPVEDARVATRYDVYPNGPVAAETLDAMLQAMRRAGRDGVAFASEGERERMLLIEPYGGGLRLLVLRRPMTTPGAYDEPAERALPPEMVRIAENAIGRRAHEEDANALHERYELRLRALIAAKTGGAVLPEPGAPQPSLAESAAAATLLAAPAEIGPDGARPEAQPAAEGKAAADAPVAVELSPREIATEILLRIIDIGDRRFDGAGWAGAPGGGQRVEAISIRPGDELTPDTVEFRVFAAEGRATPWVSNGSYAGTSGRELALTGFAARPSQEAGDRFDVAYEGWFAEAGAVGPLRNGETCVSPVPDDPLEALRVSLIERPREVRDDVVASDDENTSPSFRAEKEGPAPQGAGG